MMDMNEAHRERLKTSLKLEDLDAPSEGLSPFFWNFAFSGDEFPAWTLVSSQNVAISPEERTVIAIWATADPSDDLMARIEIATFATRAAARQALLQRVASIQVPGVERRREPGLGEIELRGPEGGVVLFQFGNLLAVVTRLGAGATDVSGLAELLQKLLRNDIQATTTDARGVPGLEAARRTPTPHRRRGRRNEPIRLEGGEPLEVRGIRAARLVMPEESPPEELPPEPEVYLPVPEEDLRPEQRITAVAEGGEIVLDREGFSFLGDTPGRSRVVLKRGRDDSSPVEEWSIDIED